MREQVAAARLLPAQAVPEPRRLDRDEHQPGLAGAVPPGAFGDLRRGRKMQEAIAPVVGGALVASGGNRRCPCLGRAHVIDHLAHATTLPHPPRRAKPGLRLPVQMPERVLVPRAPALVAGFREIVWLSPDGEIETLAPAEARRRLDGDMPMLCHAPAVARRLEMASFPALDLLELFAFVRPAQFCVPTPRGLAAALGLAQPSNMAEACVALATAARALLQQLQAESEPDIRAIAEAADHAGWAWGPAVLAALPAGEPGALRRAAGLRTWQSLGEWQERPPPPPPGNAPVSA